MKIVYVPYIFIGALVLTYTAWLGHTMFVPMDALIGYLFIIIMSIFIPTAASIGVNRERKGEYRHGS